MKAIVFGGTGWLGHHVARFLHADGIETVIVSRGRKQTFCNDMPECECIQADKQNEDDMKQIFQKRYDIIIDTVPTVASIECVLKYAKGFFHYIHCSSTGGYAPLPIVPADETCPYGGFENNSGWAAKAVVDTLVMKYFQEKGFPATVIRPCYITGPGMLPLDNLGGRRKDFIADILAERTLDLPDDGQALLQPIHILDLARSFLLAIHHPVSIGQIYNICLDHAFPLNRYLQLNATALGKEIRINHMPVQEMLRKYQNSINETGLRFLATHMCFSTAKARRDLEYIPAHSPEEAVIETAIWAARTQGLISDGQ